MTVTQKVYGTTPGGETVYIYTFTNKNGLELQVISWGATTVTLKCPDRNGKVDDVLLGFDNLKDYLNNPPYFGAIIGRVANRIAGATFTLDGKQYNVPCNDPPNSLHGGIKGFTHVNWESKVDGEEAVFTHTSPDGDEGYPGEVQAKVTYSLTDENEMQITYSATTTGLATPLNMTNHCYFNLAGQVNNNVLEHALQIIAESYLPTNDVNIPTGEIRPVKGTPFDFTKSKPIGQDIEKAGDYDNNFCLPKTEACCARVVHPQSGRILEVYTNQPGVQLYTGNSLDDIVGKGGLVYHKYGAVCLEAQGYPNAVNQPNFPSVILRPGETYSQITTYKMLVERK